MASFGESLLDSSASVVPRGIFNARGMPLLIPRRIVMARGEFYRFVREEDAYGIDVYIGIPPETNYARVSFGYTNVRGSINMLYTTLMPVTHAGLIRLIRCCEPMTYDSQRYNVDMVSEDVFAPHPQDRIVIHPNIERDFGVMLGAVEEIFEQEAEDRAAAADFFARRREAGIVEASVSSSEEPEFLPDVDHLTSEDEDARPVNPPSDGSSMSDSESEADSCSSMSDWEHPHSLSRPF